MKEDTVFYVGVDVSKAKHAVAIAESVRWSPETGQVAKGESSP